MLSHALFLPALFSTLSQSSHSYDPELYPSLQDLSKQPQKRTAVDFREQYVD